jgi:hypothetical protein
MSMTMFGMMRMVMAVRMSNKRATIGVAINGNPIPVVPLTKAASNRDPATKIVV